MIEVKTMKLLKIVLVPLISAMLVTVLLGCSSGSSSTALTGNQVATAQSGNITTDITAAGNLALSHTQDLPINLFYQGGSVGRGGTVGQVLVQVGDSVKQGEVLVSIDPTEWADQLSSLQDTITSAQESLSQAQINLQTANQNLKSAQDSENSTQLALLNAQISLETAQAISGYEYYRHGLSAR